MGQGSPWADSHDSGKTAFLGTAITQQHLEAMMQADLVVGRPKILPEAEISLFSNVNRLLNCQDFRFILDHPELLNAIGNSLPLDRRATGTKHFEFSQGHAG